jgi:MoaA/NifB/PqqE/SkfB family radical SAM enzyme
MEYDVKRLHVELTDKCNARCPLCPRTNPLDISKTSDLVKDREISFEHFKNTFEGFNIKHYHFCGNYGDPLSAKDFLKILEYIAKEDVFIHIESNASVKTPDYFKRIGEILSINPDNVMSFDLDGLEDTHSFYRRNTNFDKVIKNAKSYIANTKAKSNWQFVVFNHNKHQIEEAKGFAKEIGFTNFRSRYSSWFPNGKDFTFYENDIPHIIERAYSNSDVQHLDKIQCKSIDRGEIYLSAQGHLWPCCHTASRYTHDPELKSIVDLCGIDTIDTTKYTIHEIMNSMIWAEIENRWPHKKPLACLDVCGKVNNRSVNENVVL